MSVNATVNETCQCNESLVDRTWLDSQLYVGKTVDRAITPIWYVLGIIGNAIAACIWLRRRMRRNNSSAVYLATLSINDTLFLLLHIVQELKVAWEIPSVDFPGICEIFGFIYIATQYLAPVLVLGFTVERFIAVCFPFKKVYFCTVRRAIMVTIAMITGCLLVASMQLYLWQYNAEEDSCVGRESAMVGDEASLFSIWSWITDMLIFLIVPIVILIVNILVMVEVCRMSNAVVESAMRTSRLKTSKSSATNAMLLSVSFYVIFTTLPATIVYVLGFKYVEGPMCVPESCHVVDIASNPTWQRHVTFFTFRKIIEEICLSHYACNFFLFIITGLEFRREFCRLLNCRGDSAGDRRRSSYDLNGTGTQYTTAAVGRRHSPGELDTFVTATR